MVCGGPCGGAGAGALDGASRAGPALPRAFAARRGAHDPAVARAAAGAVAVNEAGADELDALPGVGPAIARRIIEEREKNGPFFFPEDLLNVKGIGEKTLDKLLSHIRLP